MVRPGFAVALSPLLLLACAKRPADTGAPASPAPVRDVVSAPGNATPAATTSAIPEAGATFDARAPVAEDPAALAAFAKVVMSKVRPDDVWNAYERTYQRASPIARVPLAAAVTLCRVAVVDPAPLPASKWDRANGRDLAVEVSVDGQPFAAFFGPLGHDAMYVRLDDVVRDAAAGKRVRVTLRDRDQSQAFPYVTSVEVGSVDLPADGNASLELKAPTMHLTCRGVSTGDAAVALLPDLDVALAEAEKRAAWTAADPRSTSELVSDLSGAADRLRIASVLARDPEPTGAWRAREDRLRAIVRAYHASARAWYAHLEPVPVGTWASVGPEVSARVVARVCPAVPRGANPGSLNDEQRDACGLVLELRSVGEAKVRWNVDPYGPMYACRDTGPLRFESLREPVDAEGLCVLALSRAARWSLKWLDLSPTEPTIAILGGTDFGRAIRVTHLEARAYFAAPPAPATK